MYLQWEIYYADLEPVKGKEQAWKRPVVIVSGNSFNSNGNLIMVCPLTSQLKKYYGDIILDPTKLNWLSSKSEILIFHIRAISTDRLISKVGNIWKKEIEKIIFGIQMLLNH